MSGDVFVDVLDVVNLCECKTGGVIQKGIDNVGVGKSDSGLSV